MASVAVAGSIAQRPGRGGHAWVFLNYLLGLERLGHDVVFIDRLTREMLGEGPREVDVSSSEQALWLNTVMTNAGFEDRYLLLAEGFGKGDEGVSRKRILDRLRKADLLINVNGFLEGHEFLDAPGCSVFLDIDPAIQQMWVELGLSDLFEGHDHYFSVGENLGQPFCDVPTCGRDWRSTRPPVVLDEWPASARGRFFTTVGSWRGPYGPIDYQGETYGLRVHEFRRFLDLPLRAAAEYSIAMDVDSADQGDLDNLRSAGWDLIDPSAVAGNPATYRAFIQGSLAELSVAKNVYVRSKCGWFSDRSATYLASGKPVLAQDTGYSMNLPTGEGLLSFIDLDGAVAGSEEILGNWALHSKAAREIAVEYFDSQKVLEAMLHATGI